MNLPVHFQTLPLHDSHGPGSVLDRFTQRRGKVLRLGANPDAVTLTPFAEYLADVPEKVRVRRCQVRADTGEVWIKSLDDTDGIATWSGGDDFPENFLDDRASGRRASARWVAARRSCCSRANRPWPLRSRG